MQTASLLCEFAHVAWRLMRSQSSYYNTGTNTVFPLCVFAHAVCKLITCSSTGHKTCIRAPSLVYSLPYLSKQVLIPNETTKKISHHVLLRVSPLDLPCGITDNVVVVGGLVYLNDPLLVGPLKLDSSKDRGLAKSDSLALWYCISRNRAGGPFQNERATVSLQSPI